ncbi:alcohol dehydrogenase catalytic domain-containing protein [Pseudomonas sp. H3(2019)]|uniref:alcohol dehydrogenase catalytic domain-containing protein n=1 Tax=Pseudomonas sp. H3(2019) TaxID=2598724 RepID=UPI0015B417F6|nr:alcohol dehydrogenase catalytic domain-containing protein [Pseudomonas sp. H3(2019)]
MLGLVWLVERISNQIIKIPKDDQNMNRVVMILDPTDLNVPEMMLAQTIRPERYGEPLSAFALESVPVPYFQSDECLIRVMAAGVNHNGVWAARGYPVDVIDLQRSRGEKHDFHIAGSDASGIVVAVGADVDDISIGDEVVLHCGWWDSDSVADEIMDKSAKIWGYEINFGAFAEFTRVKRQAILPKPAHLSWEQAASYMLCGATAYRMLHGFAPHTVKPGEVVLIWGGSGAQMLDRAKRHEGQQSAIYHQGSAEHLNVRDRSVAALICGQSFHWFEPNNTRLEFKRVLATDNPVFLVWNIRSPDCDGFHIAYERLLSGAFDRYLETLQIDDALEDKIRQFFSGPFQERTFHNCQRLSASGLLERTMSCSYASQPGTPEYVAASNALNTLHQEHQQNGEVTLNYRTRVVYGRV